jgi:hypothetical protein
MNFDYKTAWKTLASQKKNTTRDMIDYCLLKAINSRAESLDDKRDIAIHLLRRAFPPVSKVSKLANGRVPFDAITNNYNGMLIGLKNFVLGQNAAEVLTEEEHAELHALRLSVNRALLIRRYSYFFTRQDIFDEYQLVQTSHAALELGALIAQKSPELVKGLHFTCCGVRNAYELEEVEKVLGSMKVPYVVFREPDIGNQKTSIGVYPLEEHKRGLLRGYNLLKFDQY